MATNRIHQLNQTIYELRLRGLSERQEIRELRKAVSDQKNALEAAQREIEHLKQREASLISRWNSSHIAQNQKEYARRVLQMTPEQRIEWLSGRFDVDRKGGVYSDNRTHTIGEQGPEPSICFDARQYEALSVHRAEGKPC